MKDLSIKNIFMVIILISGIIPTVISLGSHINQIKLNITQRKLNTEKIQKSILYSITNQVLEAQKKLELLSNSAELIEYFRTPKAFRRLVENRLYGKTLLLIENSPTPIQVIIRDSQNDLIFKVGEHYIGDNISFKKEVLLDDMNMPIGRSYGFIEFIVNVKGFYEQYPIVKHVQYTNKPTVSFKKTKKSNIHSYARPVLSILILILCSFAGFALLKRCFLEPIDSLTRNLSKNNKGSENFNQKNELVYLERVTQEYTNLVREKEKNKISNQVAHDIRAPLIALQNYFLHDGVNEDIAMNALNRIEDIASKLGNKRFKSQKQLLSPLSLMKELFAEYSTRKGREIAFNNQNVVINEKVNVNKTELNAAISNIIDNALETSPQTKVKINLLKEDDFITISVVDNGPGIKNIDKIFEEGFTTKENGSGLGLFQAISFAKASGGEAKATSSPKGTTISLRLPIYNKQSILIIDDDELYLKTSGIRLRQMGFSYKLFNSKDELKKFIKSNPGQQFDVYIDQNIDIENDGLQLKEELKQFKYLTLNMNSSFSNEGKRDWVTA